MKKIFCAVLLSLTAITCVRAQQTNLPYASEINWALASAGSVAFQSSDSVGGTADLAIDGNTDGNFAVGSTTLSGGVTLDGDPPDPFWYVDLGASKAIGAIHLWFRTDCCDNRNDDFTVIVLDGNGVEVWRRRYTGRPPRDANNGLHLLYNISPAVQGQIVRFVPQNPPTTSDGFFSLAEVQVIAPYTNVTINVTQDLVPATVEEGRRITLGPVRATVVGAPQDRLTYQWQRNGVDIPGATGTNYTTGVQTLADNNTEYSVLCSVSGKSVLTAKTKLTVSKDTDAPVLDPALVFASGPALQVTLKFNEVMDATSAGQPANYGFGAGVSVIKSTLSPVLQDSTDKHVYQTVILSVVGLPPNVPYALNVGGVKDLGGNAILPVKLTGTTPFFEINWAQSGTATQSSTAAGGDAAHAIDGNTDGLWDDGSVTLNGAPEDPGWWEVDLGASKPIGRIKIWFRTLTAAECQALFNSCAVRNDDFTLVILDSSRTEVWRRTYPGRPPLQVAYNLPPGVNGQFVRFESQTPLTTSDGFFSLAEVQVIAPYQNVTLAVTKDLPAAATVPENTRALLGPVAATVTGATNAPADILQYQWQKNGVDIVGANGSSYQTPPLALSESGTRYRCRMLISGASVLSTELTLTVEKDTVPPAIKSVAGGFSYTDVTVTFTEAVSLATASALSNYSLSGGLTISDALVLTPTSVRLTTTPQTPGTKYSLTVTGIRDLASGGGNLIAANSKVDFVSPQSEANRYVLIGDAANPKDTQWNTARGQVNYVYEISKYKVSNAEYAAFLNAKAKSDPYTLWGGGGEILRDGDDGSYTYSVLPGREKRPVLYVAAVDAMRMANWLNNGGTAESDTETGAYTFAGYDVVSKRNPNADYFLPNDDEWYKAAYYDPTKNGTGGYWQFPPRTDDPNKMVAEPPPGGPFSANFNSVITDPDQPNTQTTDVGAYTAASSYYGTFDQAGLSWEWNEPADPTTKVTSRRGGSQANAIARLAAGVIANNGINDGGQTINQSFRLARAHRVRLELVAVGNPGNTKDTQWNTARGQVNYTFQIGKYKVRNSEYAVFLNSRAKSDPHTLWGGGEILRDGADGSYTYSVVPGRENRPVLYVAAVDAMRMANWLNNGATETSDTETGSYTFSGYDVVSKRNPGARYVLPNDDEWYKAAYYDPTKNGTGGYWQFPPKTDDPNQMIAEAPPGGPFSANFNSVITDPDQPNTQTTDVGAYTAASSYYGTFDQAGLSWEWNEPADPTTKVTSRRGGSQGNAIARLAAGVIANNGINDGGQTVNQSFRLALVSPQAAPPTLTIERLTATSVRITWTGSGTLQSTLVATGGWLPVAGNPASPYLVNPTGTATYYRVSQ